MTIWIRWFDDIGMNVPMDGGKNASPGRMVVAAVSLWFGAKLTRRIDRNLPPRMRESRTR